jgi:hypothetical protein
MIEIKKKKVQIKIDEVIHDIPIRNMTTSLAFKLSDLEKRREAVKQDENSDTNREAFELVNEMLETLVENYQDHKAILEEIPVDLLEDFLGECLEAIQDKKKVSTVTRRKLTESKTELNSENMDSKNQK